MNRTPANLAWLQKVAAWEEMDAAAALARQPQPAASGTLSPSRFQPARAGAQPVWLHRIHAWETRDGSRELSQQWWGAMLRELPACIVAKTKFTAALASLANQHFRQVHLILAPAAQRPLFGSTAQLSTLALREFSPAARATISIHQAALPLSTCYLFVAELHTLLYTACDRLLRSACGDEPWTKPEGVDEQAAEDAWRFCRSHADFLADLLPASVVDASALRAILSLAKPPEQGDGRYLAAGWGLALAGRA